MNTILSQYGFNPAVVLALVKDVLGEITKDNFVDVWLSNETDSMIDAYKGDLAVLEDEAMNIINHGEYFDSLDVSGAICFRVCSTVTDMYSQITDIAEHDDKIIICVGVLLSTYVNLRIENNI